jgi:hypothetical protein
MKLTIELIELEVTRLKVSDDTSPVDKRREDITAKMFSAARCITLRCDRWADIYSIGNRANHPST